MRHDAKRRIGFSAAWFVAGLLAIGPGCTTYRDALQRSRTAYAASEHEQALAILRSIEHDVPRLSRAETTQYFYLRGMTDFRIGYRAEARHWLALAQAAEHEHPGALPEAWRDRLEESLDALNGEVYQSGVGALANDGKPPRDPETPPL